MGKRSISICSVIFLIIIVFSNVYTYAGQVQSYQVQRQQAKTVAESVSGQFKSRYGSSEGMKNNVINPLMGNSTMTTFNGKKSFKAQLECPAEQKFLSIFFMPYSTGDFKADITVWPKDSSQAMTLEIDNVSGICQNGYIACNKGTWNNCRFFKWQWKNNMLGTYEEPDDTELGQCICVNNSCGMNFEKMWEQIRSLFSANLAVFVADHLDEAISKVSLPVGAGGYVEDFYGQDPKSCKVVSTGDYAGSPYKNLKNYYHDSNSLNDAVSAEVSSESSNSKTPYYNVINSEYMQNSPYEYKECVIQRVPTVDNSTWIAKDGSEYDISCQSTEPLGGGYYWCSLTNLTGEGSVPPGFCGSCSRSFKFLAKTNWYFFGSVYDDYGIAISINGVNVGAWGMWHDCGASTDPWDPAWVWVKGDYHGGQQEIHVKICEDEYKSVQELSAYRGSPPDCGGNLILDTTYQVAFDGEPVTIAIRNSGECNSGDGMPAVDASAQLMLRRRIGIKVDTQDSCSNMNLTGCKLKDEIICSHAGANEDNQSQGCFYTWRNYHSVATSTTSAVCQAVSDPEVPNSQYVVCTDGNKIWYYPKGNQVNSTVVEDGSDLWWYVKRVYKCNSQGITVNGSREGLVASSVHNGGTENGYTVYPYNDTIKSGEIKWDSSYNQDNCTYSCIFKNVGGQRSFAIASGNEAIGANIGSSISNAYKIVPCKQDPQTGQWTCPTPEGNWEKIQDCQCTNQGVQTIAVMQALIEAARDLTCSQE